MKQTLTLLVAAVCLIAATSCQKQAGQFHAKKVRIDKIWGPLYPAHWDTLRFYYNAQGNPDSIIRNYDDFRHAQTRIVYDGSGRPKGLVNYMRNPIFGKDFESWHKFVYNGLNQIVRDTIIMGDGEWGPDDEPHPTPGGYIYPWVIYHFTYDALGRIVHQDEDWSGATATVDYYYGTAGNLDSATYAPINETPYTLVYQHDTLKSFLGTHPLWQVMARDFSKNNKFTPTTLGSWGYPATISRSSSYNNFEWLFNYTNAFDGELNISYKKY